MGEKILTEYLHDRQSVRLVLHAPKANVLDSAMMAELHEQLTSLAGEPGLKLVQLTGAGDHFSFGASVQEHTRDRAPAMLSQFHALFYDLVSLAVPTVALVSGQCLGGGLELAAACSFVFADQTAKMGQPEITLGVFAPVASLILPLKIGQTRADDLLITGRSVSASEAASMGLVTRVFDSREAMLKEVDEWAVKQILPKSASSLKFASRAARQEFNTKLMGRLKTMEAVYVNELMATHDANEGIGSFLEKRPPAWKNN